MSENEREVAEKLISLETGEEKVCKIIVEMGGKKAEHMPGILRENWSAKGRG